MTALNQGNYTVLGQKLMGAIQAGSLPELAHAYESNVADYMKAATVVDLGPYKDSKVNGLTKTSQDDIYKGYYDTNIFPQFGNQLLSWPFTKSLAVMYVNEDILKELGKPIPKTWDEFEATAAAAVKKDASGKTTRYGFGFTTDASYFNAQVYSRGGSLMAADNQTVAWNGKEGLQVLQMYDRMNKNGSGYTPAGFDWQNHDLVDSIPQGHRRQDRREVEHRQPASGRHREAQDRPIRRQCRDLQEHSRKAARIVALHQVDERDRPIRAIRGDLLLHARSEVGSGRADPEGLLGKGPARKAGLRPHPIQLARAERPRAAGCA